jgi:hypothetical protein
MIGITLSSGQIRNASAEARQWIEREVMTSLGSRLMVADVANQQLAAAGQQERAAGPNAATAANAEAQAAPGQQEAAA